MQTIKSVLITDDFKAYRPMKVSEIILNAIEHGNCGISYAEKSKWLASGKSINDLIRERCQQPKIAQKMVNIDMLAMNQTKKTSS